MQAINLATNETIEFDPEHKFRIFEIVIADGKLSIRQGEDSIRHIDCWLPQVCDEYMPRQVTSDLIRWYSEKRVNTIIITRFEQDGKPVTLRHKPVSAAQRRNILSKAGAKRKSMEEILDYAKTHPVANKARYSGVQWPEGKEITMVELAMNGFFETHPYREELLAAFAN